MRPSAQTPDLERLLLETARQCHNNVRLFELATTWLSLYAPFVARHRLKSLVIQELDRQFQPVLGLILETSIELGASRELNIAAEPCKPAANGQPLFTVQRQDEHLRKLALKNASALSRRWGVWAPPVTQKLDAIRPAQWLLDKNPTWSARVIRKGDLRCSILEALRHDTQNGSVDSEAQLARLCSATRAATSKALNSLVQEGAVVIQRPANTRSHSVALAQAA